jgi:hypothetical protein
MFPVPRCRTLCRGAHIPHRTPTKAGRRLAAIEFEDSGFMRLLAVVLRYDCSITVRTDKLSGQWLDSDNARIWRSEIPSLGIVITVNLTEPPREMQVTGEWLQDVLPWPGGAGIAQAYGHASLNGAHTVRDNTIISPITTADDISRAAAGQAATRRIAEKWPAPTRDS